MNKYKIAWNSVSGTLSVLEELMKDRNFAKDVRQEYVVLLDVALGIGEKAGLQNELQRT